MRQQRGLLHIYDGPDLSKLKDGLSEQTIGFMVSNLGQIQIEVLQIRRDKQAKVFDIEGEALVGREQCKVSISGYRPASKTGRVVLTSPTKGKILSVG